ncbi:MAG: tetratricopeptide repeat protein [Marinobacter sp.]
MEGLVVLIIVVALLFVVIWAFKSKTDSSQTGTTPRSAQEPQLDVSQQITASSAQRLVEIINESLQIANDSKNADTKISRLDLAKERLDELKDLVKENPWIKIDQLSDVEQTISTLEWEFKQANYREAADGNMRGQALEKEGKVEEALLEYEKLLEQGVDTPFTYRRLAILYSKRKDRENELRVLRAALKNVPVENSKHYQWFAERLAKKSE